MKLHWFEENFIRHENIENSPSENRIKHCFGWTSTLENIESPSAFFDISHRICHKVFDELIEVSFVQEAITRWNEEKSSSFSALTAYCVAFSRRIQMLIILIKTSVSSAHPLLKLGNSAAHYFCSNLSLIIESGIPIHSCSIIIQRTIIHCTSLHRL